MADWTDGAEYAPVERPAGFATPRASALQVIEAEPSPADGQPVEAPGDYQPPTTIALAELAPGKDLAERNPQEPFTTHASADSAWGAVHSSTGWDPTMPLGDPSVSSEPATDFPPPQGAPVAPAALGGSSVPGASPVAEPMPAVVAIPLQGQFPPPTGEPAPLPPPATIGQQLPQALTPAPAPAQAPAQAQGQGQAPAPVPASPPQPAQQFNPFAPAPRNGQQPAQWPTPSPGRSARRSSPSRLTPVTVVSETGPLILAVLTVGALIPGFGAIMLVIASILSRRQNPTNVVLRALYNVAIWAVLLSWVASAILSPETSAWSGSLGRWLCAVMIPASLGAVYDELRKRMGR